MTSYHHVNIVATMDELQKVKGLHLSYCGLDEVDEKVQMDFSVMVHNEPLGYIYSWMEYRELDRFDRIEFHIGAKDFYSSMRLKKYVENKLKEIR
jgi:hypothetical protein